MAFGDRDITTEDSVILQELGQTSVFSHSWLLGTRWMQTEQGSPTEVSKARALPSRGYPGRDRKLATPAHTRQNESRGKRDIQRTSGEYGEEKLISSLPFFGLTLWLPCHTYGSLVTLMAQAFLTKGKVTVHQATTEHYCQEMRGSEKDRKTAHEELKQYPLFCKMTAALRARS